MAFFQAFGISKMVGDQWVLKPVELSFEQHQTIAVAGETGSGKTSLLKIMAGLMEPDSGSMTLQGKKVSGPADRLIPGDPRVAYLSQYFELRNHYRVEEELDYINKLGAKEASAILEVCQITHLLKRYTHQLSGGEKQRIATARAILSRPLLLLLDEPFSNLDPFHKKIMQQVIAGLKIQLGITVGFADHDPRDTLSRADRIFVLRSGEVVQEGSPAAIYHHPADAYVASLFGTWSAWPEAWEKERPSGFSVLRPEQLQIAAGQTDGLPGKVIRSLFYGSHYEVTVAVGREFLEVYSTQGYDTGTVVAVSLNPAFSPL